MKIGASVGRAPLSTTLEDEVYSLSLWAETCGEKQFLAGLFPALRTVGQRIKLSAYPPKVTIRIEYKKRKLK